ncbi:hypothetical protein GCM10027589_07600 [Actinocorallia lasiicapitis]
MTMTEKDQQAIEPDRTATSPVRRRRRPVLTWTQLAVALLIALTAAGLLFLPERPGASPAADNHSLIDVAATEQVITEVGDGLVKVLSYTPDTLAATEQAATTLLEGRAAEQYKQLFGTLRTQVPAQKLTLSTRVVRAGVNELTADKARLLFFLDQTQTKAGKPAGTLPAQLSVSAVRRDGRWLITEIASR